MTEPIPASPEGSSQGRTPYLYFAVGSGGRLECRASGSFSWASEPTTSMPSSVYCAMELNCSGKP